MNKFIAGVSVALLGGIGVKLYGKYKYSCGRCDANEFNKIIIDAQHSLIKDLLNKLKEAEEDQ